MTQAPQPGGYIFLWRSLVNNGHLKMPEIPFKLFIYLLLQVNRYPANGCDIGEGWITYRMIKEACCKPDKQWADSTISRALDYLEGKNNDGPGGRPEVYIKRIRTKKGGPQKISVLNFWKYQSLASSFMQEVGRSAEATADKGYSQTSCTKQEPPLAPALDKQDKKEEEEEAMRMIEWVRWYEEKFALFPSRRDFEDMERLRQRGVTDDLIIAVLEEALSLDHIDRPLLWAKRRISDLLPRGVITAEDYRRRKKWIEKKRVSENKADLPPLTVEPEDDEFMRQLKEKLREEALREQHGADLQ